jgi:hypothetical protein
MQTYAQRTIQARIRDASTYLTEQTSQIGSTNQYEPYYLVTDYNVERDDSTTEIQSQYADGSGLFQMQTDSTRTRQDGGFQESSYNTALGLINGI